MNNIRTKRRMLNMTMKQLAAKVGVTEAAISHYETGRREPDPDMLGRIANALGVSVDYLLGRETTEQMTVTREGPIEVVRFDGTKKDDKSNMLAAILAELETMSEEDLKVALQHARFLRSQKERRE